MNRNLSGIYIRHEIDGKFENVCFEDLPKKDQEAFLNGKSKEWVDGMALALAEKLKDIGDALDLVGE